VVLADPPALLGHHRFGTAEDYSYDMAPPIAQALGESVRGGELDDLGDGAPESDAPDTGLAEVERRLLHVIRSPWLSFLAVPLIVHGAFLRLDPGLDLIKPPHTFERGWRNGLLVAFGCLTLLPVTATSRASSRRSLPSIASSSGWPTPPQSRRCAPVAVAAGAVARGAIRPVGKRDRGPALSGASARSGVAGAIPSLRNCHDACTGLLRHELRYEAGPAGGVLESSGNRALLVRKLLSASSALSRSRDELPEALRPTIDDFVASVLAVFIPRYVRQFRLFMPPLVVGSVLAVLMTSSLLRTATAPHHEPHLRLGGGLRSHDLRCLRGLDRDPVISAMATRPPARELELGPRETGCVVGLLPIVSLFAAQ